MTATFRAGTVVELDGLRGTVWSKRGNHVLIHWYSGEPQITISGHSGWKSDQVHDEWVAIGDPRLRSIGREDARAIAARIQLALDDPNDQWALRHFIQLNDNLVDAQGYDRLRLAQAGPRTTTSPGWDAAIAGLVEHRLAEINIVAPAWTAARWLTLTQPWTPNTAYDLGIPDSDIPDALARRGIRISRHTLESV